MADSGVGKLEKDIEDTWVIVLAYIYRSVNWKKIARNRSSYDIFEHRLCFARYEPTVPDIIQKLCNTLSLQAPPLPIDKIECLRKYEKLALKVIRRWTKLLTLKAAQKSREIKKRGE